MEELSKSLNPYIGPKPFQVQDKDNFFGRDEEATKLLSMIFANKIVILSAQSGAGKSSLLNARMVELLKNEKFEIFKIQGLSSYISRDTIPDNVFVYNSVLALLKNDKANQDLESLKLSACLESIDPELAEHRFVIIIDQFEELFSSHFDRWNDRQEFLKQIQEICNNYTKSRIIFAIREDFLGRFGSISNNLKQSPYNFHLELLNKEKALSAIKRPVEQTSRCYEEGVAEKIVEELLKIKMESHYLGENGKKLEKESIEIQGEFVEPVQLQIVCKTLWESLKPDDQKITITHLTEIGGVERVLENYYSTAIKKALKNYPDKERSVRDWFERELITPIGTRGSYLQSKIKSEGIPQRIIDLLLESYLIRTEERAGATWISLSHDRFIEPIRKSNRKWIEEQLKREQQVQQEKIQEVKKRFFSYFLWSLAFIVPLVLLAVFIWLPSRLVSTYDKAFKYIYEGKKYYTEEKYEQAEERFISSLNSYETAEASIFLARTYTRLNDSEKAIQQFQQTIQLDPNAEEAYYDLGLLLIENNRLEEGYEYILKFLEISKRRPRTVLTPELYTDLVTYYFCSRINAADSQYRRNSLNLLVSLIRQHIPYTPMGRTPEQGFDNSGFITYVLRQANVIDDSQIFDPKNVQFLRRTNEPQPMDLIYYPGFNQTVLFYLGEFFGERLAIGIGMTAFVDVVNISQINYPFLFYHFSYQ